MGGIVDAVRARGMQILASGLALAALAMGVAMLIAQADARHWRAQFAGEQARHRVTIAETKLATAEARANDLAHAAAVQARDAAISKEQQHDIQTQLADSLTLAARYAERMRRTATGDGARGGGNAAVSADAGAASDPAGGAGFALVPRSDLDVCARNTVIARGWQAWWAEVSRVGR